MGILSSNIYWNWRTNKKKKKIKRFYSYYVTFNFSIFLFFIVKVTEKYIFIPFWECIWTIRTSPCFYWCWQIFFCPGCFLVFVSVCDSWWSSFFCLAWRLVSGGPIYSRFGDRMLQACPGQRLLIFLFPMVRGAGLGGRPIFISWSLRFHLFWFLLGWKMCPFGF